MIFIQFPYILNHLLFIADPGTLTIWGILACMLFFAFRFFRSALNSANHKSESLRTEIDAMRQQMDSMAKNETAAIDNAQREGAAKSKLLSAISHEVRTPMNGIMGMAALLKETTLTTEQKDYTETIIRSGKILLDKVNEILIQDLLESSKSDAISSEPDYKTIELIPCIEETLELFSKKSAQAGISLLYKINTGTPSSFISDEKRIRKILVNLIDNAVAVNHGGNIILQFETNKRETPGDYQLYINVIDEGPGIPAHMLQTIFSQTLPTDYSTRNREKNKGLGLLICKKLVEQMGGSIQVKNNTDKGCTFTVSLPVVTPVSASNNAQGYSMKGFEGEQVLIVSENDTASSIYANWLEQWGLVTVTVNNLKQAAELLTQVKYRLAIIDPVVVENADIIETGKTLSEKFPKLKQIILVTTDDSRYKEMEGASVTFLRKPLQQHAFFDAVLTQFRHDEQQPATTQRANKLSEQFVSDYPLRILIAEDNEVNQKWTSKILKKLGYTATIAENGKIVLDKVSVDNYDLILMDVQMPEMDGLEATRMIRVCLEKQPVIIAMTANVMHGDRQACIQAGMDDYISKPVELSALVNMLEKWGTRINEKKLQS
ncbi:MAG: response regulator [Chitinophagaceae bacterium]